jgi:hypothetical protein
MRARCYDLRWSARIHQKTSGSRACKRNSRCFTAGRKSKACTKAGAASCIAVYHNCATSAASLRIQRSFSLVSLRSGIGKRNEGISLTQCMVLGGLGSNETILGVAPCAKHHSLLLSYLFNLKRGLAFVRDMIIADVLLSTSERCNRRQIYWSCFGSFSPSIRKPRTFRGCGLSRKIAVKQEPVFLRPFSPPNL